jgi:hypothetical protein
MQVMWILMKEEIIEEIVVGMTMIEAGIAMTGIMKVGTVGIN